MSSVLCTEYTEQQQKFKIKMQWKTLKTTTTTSSTKCVAYDAVPFFYYNSTDMVWTYSTSLPVARFGWRDSLLSLFFSSYFTFDRCFKFWVHTQNSHRNIDQNVITIRARSSSSFKKFELDSNESQAADSRQPTSKQ